MKRSATSKNYGGKHEPLIRASRTVSSPADRSATAAAIAPRPTKWGEGGARAGRARCRLRHVLARQATPAAMSPRPTTAGEERPQPRAGREHDHSTTSLALPSAPPPDHIHLHLTATRSR